MQTLMWPGAVCSSLARLAFSQCIFLPRGFRATSCGQLGARIFASRNDHGKQTGWKAQASQGTEEGQEGPRRGGRCLPAEEEGRGGCSEGCARQGCQGWCPWRWYQEVWEEVNPPLVHLSVLRPSSTCMLSRRGSLVSPPPSAQLALEASVVVHLSWAV